MNSGSNNGNGSSTGSSGSNNEMVQNDENGGSNNGNGSNMGWNNGGWNNNLIPNGWSNGMTSGGSNGGSGTNGNGMNGGGSNGGSGSGTNGNGWSDGMNGGGNNGGSGSGTNGSGWSYSNSTSSNYGTMQNPASQYPGGGYPSMYYQQYSQSFVMPTPANVQDLQNTTAPNPNNFAGQMYSNGGNMGNVNNPTGFQFQGCCPCAAQSVSTTVMPGAESTSPSTNAETTQAPDGVEVTSTAAASTRKRNKH